MARGCASGGGEEGDREHQQPSPWSGYISVRFFTASESNPKLGVSTTPRAYSWCRSMRLPKTNWAALVRSKQSIQLVRQTPFCRAIASRYGALDHVQQLGSIGRECLLTDRF